ncbi:MAG: hypothetical protein WC765_07015 [Phycisphaerae bacterium]|jgi:hypothetical protein
MKTVLIIFAAFCASLASLVDANAASVVPTSTEWDSGVSEGWTSIGGLVTYPLTGGVSGGYLSSEDIQSNDMTIYAPTSYLGDYTALIDNAYFSVALRTLVQGSDIWPPFGTLTLTGPSGKYKVDLGNPPPVSSGWVTFSLPLNEATWNRVSGTWTGLLQNVTEVSLDIEGGSAITETTGVDNFELIQGQLDTPRITGIRVNSSDRQEFGWFFIGGDGIEQIEIQFSENMTGADQVVNFQFSSTGGFVPPSPTLLVYDSNKFVTTMVWGSPFMNQNLTVTCLSGASKIRSQIGVIALDGEIYNPFYPTLPSGNGTAGGNTVFTVRHLMGDLNRDGSVDFKDFALMAGNWLNMVN